MTALHAQLVVDYLPATGATRGVYVCAWFPIDQWDDEDDARRKTAVTRDRDEVQRSLKDAAKIESGAGDFEVSAIVVDIPRPVRSRRAK